MSLRNEAPFRLGVVEGFFGTEWSWQARHDYADFLVQHGFNTYLYAPKAEALLRKAWHEPFPQEKLDKLNSLAEYYHARQLDFGVGLSPFEVYRNFDTSSRDLLAGKLEQINSFNPSVLCILFDDMQGNFPELARQQVEITEFITEKCTADNFIFCPTYYSDDPKLVEHFGDKPENYLEDIGKYLDPAIDIFWTGPEVFSALYSVEHLQSVAEKLKRLPLIWDNYPVNDAERMTDFLHLAPFPDQNEVLQKYSAGHLANPMNQAYLSQLPLFTLSSQYQGIANDNLLSQACQTLCPPGLAECLVQDAGLFQTQGLSGITSETKAKLKDRYKVYANHPMAKEIIDWLDGNYAFDPNCLT